MINDTANDNPTAAPTATSGAKPSGQFGTDQLDPGVCAIIVGFCLRGMGGCRPGVGVFLRGKGGWLG